MDAHNVRAATLEDVALVTDLLNAVDILEVGRAETDLVSVRADLSHADADLPRNSWLGFVGDRLVVYGLLWDDSAAERIDMDQYGLPEHQDLAEEVMALMEARAVEKAGENGAERAVVHLSVNVNPTMDLAMLGRRGWKPVRRYYVMTRQLTADTDPLPTPPTGLTLRDCQDEADRRIAHALLQETFADHYDHQDRSYEKWLDDLGELVDWSKMWVAAVDGEDVAVMVTSNHRKAHAWINALGVRRQARGKGIGGFLLRHAFATYAALGRDRIGLGVDTENESGALRLYEANGMGQYFAVDNWEVVLPVPRPARPAPQG